MQNYNIIRETVDVTETSGPVTEPVTLAEVKDYLRLEGTDGSGDFDFDDDLLEEFITTARQSLEQELAVSIIQHDYEARGLTNDAGPIQLAFGPVREVTEITDTDDEVIDDDVKIRGDYLRLPSGCDLVVAYSTGYDEDKIPKPFITEIKRMVAYMYEHRGDEDSLQGYKYSGGVYKYSRRPWLE